MNRKPLFVILNKFLNPKLWFLKLRHRFLLLSALPIFAVPYKTPVDGLQGHRCAYTTGSSPPVPVSAHSWHSPKAARPAS